MDHGLHSAPIENDYPILLIVGEHVRERVLLPQPQRQRDAGLCPVHSRCRRTAGPQMNSRPDKWTAIPNKLLAHEKKLLLCS